MPNDLHDAIVATDGPLDPSARESQPMERSPSTFVVGIGASAGGLEALENFFEHVPIDLGMAYVVIQHLSPDFKSMMNELLARRTRLPIHLVEDGMLVEADHIYLIPPKKEMIISGGRLLLSEREREHDLALPIDVFFRSLARDCANRAIAVVLSGGGSDGSRGIRDVHEAGGLVLVQDAATAQFDGMPKTAEEAGVADALLAPGAMPAFLAQHARQSRELGIANGTDDLQMPSDGLRAIYQLLQDEFRIDFTDYKPSTVTRRIARRLSLAETSDINEYVRRLVSERDELDVLYRDLLIGVTRFFRDPEAYRVLEETILTELLARARRDEPVRVWVAGCATGEEAYSFAIAMQDIMNRVGERPAKIFATDVHRGSLERASRAIYGSDAIANVSPERLERYFRRVGDSYQVVPEVRQMVVFAPHNVIKDVPFTRVDVISCRNMLIYLHLHAQQRVLSRFHFALKRNGALFLGPSETTGEIGYDFDTVDKHWRVYRKRTERRVQLEPRNRPLPAPDVRVTPVGTSPLPTRHSLTRLLGIYDQLLEDVMAPSLLVDENGDVVHAFGGASQFLRFRDGRQSLNVFDVVDSEVKVMLAGLLKRAMAEPRPFVVSGVRAGKDDARQYDVRIRKILPRNGGAAHVLITFEESAHPVSLPSSRHDEIDVRQAPRAQIEALEAELSQTKDCLQATVENLEASNEELQASNEELRASNEELQSTNEELQSVNEELYTVNGEYQRKIAELTELSNDIDNLLSATEIGTIFLDAQLRIRKFTPQIAATFDLLPHDVGRPIETFATRMRHPELLDDLKRVLTTGTSVERELRDIYDKTFFLRVLPYRAKGSVAGVVLTLIDVSGLRAAEDALFHERYLLDSLLASTPDAIYFRDARGRIIRANHAMAARLGLRDPREAVGKTAFDLPEPERALAFYRLDEPLLRNGRPELYKLEERPKPDGTPSWDMVTRLPLRDAAGQIVGVGSIFRDVTPQKIAEQKIQDAVRRRDQFLAMLSHELRNPLAAIVTATGLLAANGPDGARKPTRLLEVLHRQSQQMARLLDDLLEASRVTQNKIELRRRVIDLVPVSREAADAARPVFEARGVDFRVELPTQGIYIDGDPARLQQIQANLLSNAAKYTPRGGHVLLSVRVEESDAVIVVRDDGVGIPTELIGPIFELFVQSARTLDRSAGGIGVGLTLVRALVEMHGGTVSARSEGENKGSEFTVRLPISEGVGDTTSDPLPSTAYDKAHGKTVLVVEDNDDNRQTLCELLALGGFECLQAGSGTAALELIDRCEPGIAILDVGLPEMDGFELARRIRANPLHGDMFLIALTGYGQQSDRMSSKSAGFNEHLVKPVETDKLLRIVASASARVPH